MIARSKLPAQYIEIKKGEIRKSINAMSDEVKKKGGDIPGIRVFQKTGVASKTT